jgi:hypothetical protein
MSLIFATQLTAVATVALAVFAFAAAILATLAFRKQSQEVAVLLKESKREAADRRRAQAARVFTGETPLGPRGLVRFARAENASDFPVFDVQSWYSRDGDLTEYRDHGVILPGQYSDVWGGRNNADAIAHTVLAFRDAAGVRWIRMPDGTLKEQTRDTARESVLVALGVPLPPLARL